MSKKTKKHELIRNCPNCNSEIRYGRLDSMKFAEKNGRLCLSCTNTGKNNPNYKPELEDVEYWIKTCNICGCDMKYDIKYHYDRAVKNNTNCRKCCHTPEVRRKIRISMLQTIENRYGKVYPNYNPASIPIIEEKARELGITDLQHAENGGEYHIKELGYFVDGYSKEKNIVIEYYELHHKRQIESDNLRKNEIIEHLGCEFIIIEEQQK